MAVAIVLGIGAPVYAEDPPSSDLFVVTRDPFGDVSVVHGPEALRAAVDVLVGRSPDEILSIEQDAPVHSLGTNDPLRWQQWTFDKTSFEAAWTSTRGAGVTVAVIDSGVRGDHEDLAAALVAGTDYVNPGGDGRTDPNGHGTHVAGIIAAAVNNGRGGTGGAPDAHIMPIRVLDANGSGYTSDVAAGIIFAADHGVRVVNLSLGGTQPSPGTQQAMQYALSKGTLVVAAAGNGADSGNAPVYPGAFPEAVAVAAVDANLARASFSNYGGYVDIAAPGVGIVSTYNSSASSYASASGTSMATPYAAAAAALIVARNPALDAEGVRSILLASARDIGPAGRDDEYGNGLIDPRAAVSAAVPPPASPPPSQGTQGSGYWVVTAEGRVLPFGNAQHYGDLAGKAIGAPIVASAPTKSGHGYWLAGMDGAVYAFGDAGFYGSMGGQHLNSIIMGIAATPTGGGYILLGADGGIFTFGDAGFYGSTGGMRLNAPVLDIAATATGRGYWFVAADGGVFTFGDATFRGSTGNLQLAAPVTSMTSSSDGNGYWMVARDGGVFAFNVPFIGSLPSLQAQSGTATMPPAKRMRAVPAGQGYYILGADGAVFSFGTAAFFGAAPGTNAVDMMLTP